jgi:hypothetical protein
MSSWYPLKTDILGILYQVNWKAFRKFNIVEINAEEMLLMPLGAIFQGKLGNALPDLVM